MTPGLTPILALDTTSKFASISVSKGEEIIMEYNFATRDELSATLIPSLNFLLNSAGLTLNDIEAFGISIGPGMFTGLRVGLSTLKGLLIGTGKPVVPVVTLEALAYKRPAKDKRPIIPLIDARRNEVYTAVYSYENEKLVQMQSPALIHIDQLKDFLKDYEKYRFIGSGVDVHKEFLTAAFNNCKFSWRSCFLASEIAKIAYRRFQKKEYITDLQQLAPLYLRKPDAEVNFGK